MASDDERTDCVLATVIVDWQVAAFGVADQAAPVFLHVRQRSAERALGCDAWKRLFHPAMQRGQCRHAMLQARQQAHLVCRILAVTFDAVQLADQGYRFIGPAALAFGLHPDCVDKAPAHMRLIWRSR